MVYHCTYCDYITCYKCNYDKHINRKNPCHRVNNGNNVLKRNGDGNENSLHQNVIPSPPKRHPLHQNVIPLHQNVIPKLKVNTSIVNSDTSLECDFCKKKFSRSDSLRRHHKICKGVVAETFKCSSCLLCFTSRQSRNRHEHRDACHQRSVVNNNYTQNNMNTTNNIDNSIHNTQTNNIHINVFGQEDLTYLLKDKELVHRINNYSKDGVYGLVRMFDEIFMNKDRPENNTLIKPHDRGDGLYIRKNDDWEYREYEDIKECIVGSLDRYIDMYQQVKKGNNIKLTDPKERNRVKQLIVLLLTIGGMTNDELCEELNVDHTCFTEEEDERMNKKFDKATLNRIYAKTDVLFQKNGSGWSTKKINNL